MHPFRRVALASMLAVLALSGMPLEAAQKAATHAGPAKKKPPPGMLASAEAAASIESLYKDMDKRYKEAHARFYYGGAYLEQLFKEAGVQAKAMGYAKAWGDNTVYLNWAEADDFYTVHLDALWQSLNSVKAAPWVKAGDIAYLEKGMSLWLQHEEPINAGLTGSAKLFAQQAKTLGERMELESQTGASEAARKTVERRREQLASQAADLRRQAGEAAKAAIERAKARLFSAIAAPERIGVACDWQQTERAGVPDLGQLVETRLKEIEDEKERYRAESERAR